MKTLVILLIALALVSALYQLGAALAVRRFVRRAIPVPRARPPVTVLKPLYGLDPGLADNLRSFLRQDWPRHEVIAGLRDAADAARPIAESLAGEGLLLVIDPRRYGSNAKVSNLLNAARDRAGEIVVLADSDMRVGPGYLAALAAELERPGVGLVTCLYVGRPLPGLWSRLGAMGINHQFLPSALVSDALGNPSGCFGATIALRAETLAAIGGFAAFASILADDHAMGEAVRGLGLTVALSPMLVDDILEEPSFSALWQHELRWARTIRGLAPSGYAGSLLTHALPLGALGAGAALIAGWGWVALAVAGLAIASRACLVYSVDACTGARATPAWAIPMRDALSLAIWIAAWGGRKVAWRGDNFRVDAQGVLEPDQD